MTALAPGALPQDILKQARERYGTEGWSGVIHQFIESNVGGKGTAVMFENVYTAPDTPNGVIIYIWQSSVWANGNRTVVAGYFIPQTDGALLPNLWFVPELGTGIFAGATGTITELRPLPGGFFLGGTISTVGESK